MRRRRSEVTEAAWAFAASGLSLRAYSRATGIPRMTLVDALETEPLADALPTHCPRCGEQYWVEVAALSGVQWEECRCGARPVPLRRGGA